jgi:hypothetical protein
VRDEHAPTAVALDAQLVQDLLGVLRFLGLSRSRFEFLPVLADHVPARETAYWYHHG